MLRASKFFTILLISVFPFLFGLHSCEAPEKENNNQPEEIEEINLLLDESALKSIVDNPWQNNYIPVKVVIKSTGDTVSGKLRIRGDSSRGYGKKSFKLKFDREVEVFNDRSEINLNSAWTDKTYLREYASYLTYEAFGVPAAHTTHIFVKVNNKPYGLYMEIENVDDNFLKLHGFDTKGSLYKAYRDGACLTAKEDVLKLWRRKNNRRESYKDLMDLIREINATSVKDFKKFLKKRFDYDEFITVLAVNIVIQNGSTYYHNYFLYHDLWGSGKWTLIPWDLDKTIAYYNWKPYKFYDTGYNNPLIHKSLLNKDVFADIKNKVFEIVHLFFNEKVLLPKLKERAELIEKYIPQDTLDKIEKEGDWKEYVRRELEFVIKRQENLIEFFSGVLPVFSVVPVKHTCIKPPVLSWHPVKYDKPVKYDVVIGLEHQLKEEGKTWHLATVSDTFYVLPDTLKEGHYYWRIIAKSEDGKEMYGLGMSEEFDYKKPVVINRNHSNDSIVFKTEESPYLITKDVIFDKCNVVFEPGVEVFFAKDVSMFFTGCSVKFSGTIRDSIFLIPAGGYWKLLEFDRSNAALNYVSMTNGKFTYHNSTIDIRNSFFNITNGFLGHNASMIWGSHGNVHIKNCRLYSVNDSLGEGINLVKTKAVIEGNYIENIPDAIELISSDSSLIFSNFVKHSGDDGIDFNDCDRITIKNNYLYKNRDKGISIGCEQYGPTSHIISVHNTIWGNKTGIASKDSSCITDENSLFVKNKTALRAYLKNNYYTFTNGGCLDSRNSAFIDNDKFKHADKHSVISVKNAVKGTKESLVKLKKDWYVYKDFEKGAVPFEIHWIRSDSLKLISVTNLFKNPLRLSDFWLYSGNKKICKMPDIYLESGETLYLADKLLEQILRYNDNKTNFLFKCKKIRKASNAPLILKHLNEKKD